MEWSRVKTIMIGVFCVVNIILLVNYFSDSRTIFSIDAEAIENTVIILEKHNIGVNHGIIPSGYQDMRTFEVEKKYETTQKLAEDLWETADGTGLDYFNPQHTRITDREFEYTAPRGVIPEFEILKAQKYAAKIVSSLGLDDKMTLESQTVYYGGITRVTFLQMYEQIAVLDTSLTFEFDEKGLISIKGDNWFCDGVLSGGIAAVKPITEILVGFAVNFEFEERKTIIDITQGYCLGDRWNKRITAIIPAWKICFDDGEEYYFDARNGDLL